MIHTIILIVISTLFNSGALAYTKIQPPMISGIKTIPASEGWVYLPEGDGEFIIQVSTVYANELKVWRVPTGTQQWDNRTLICDQYGNKNDWTCIWRYTKDDNIHDHFVVEAIGEGESSKDSINVTRRHDKNHPQ